jgi:tetratricopeptide (TPR) repeat protein
VVEVAGVRMLGFRSWFITFLAEAYLVLGRITEAQEQAEQAVALARAHEQRSREAGGLKLLGDVHARVPAKSEQGGAAYRHALALATDLGMRPLVAHCHLGLGKLYRQTSQRTQAREHLTTAATLYLDMGMQFWLEHADVEIKELA